LSAAIELKKNEPRFYNYKALALYMIGQYELSLSIFEEALKLYEQKKAD
jgi:tetratricopeptide (TPR) repeat protein